MSLPNARSTFVANLHELGSPATHILRTSGIYLGIYSVVVGLPYFLLWRSYKKALLEFVSVQNEVLVSGKNEARLPWIALLPTKQPSHQMHRLAQLSRLRWVRESARRRNNRAADHSQAKSILPAERCSLPFRAPCMSNRMFANMPSFDYESKCVKRLLRDSASVGWAKTASRKLV
jgi:hypothetical protein